MADIGYTAAQDDKDIGILEDAGGYGFKRYSGIVSEEFHANLKGKMGMRVYREMGDNDPLLGGAFRGMKLLIRQSEWPTRAADVAKAVDAGHGEKAALEAEANRWKDRLEETMYDMEVSWRQIIDEMMSAFQYGFCLMWIKYKLRRGDNPSRLLNSQFNDGLWGWRSLEIRKQDTIERWIYDETDETLLGAEQLAPPHYKRSFLPLDRMVHLRFETAAGSPEGRSGFRNSYRPYYFGNRKEEIEGTGIERDLSGYPVITVPKEVMRRNASDDEKYIRALMQNLVRKVKRDELEGAVMPSEDNADGTKSGFTFKLMSSGGSRAININESIVRSRVDKLIPLMWEFALLGALESGSRALSSDKTQLVSVALGGMMDMMVETINQSAVQRWCRLNQAPRWLWPELTHGDIEKENVLEWVNSVVQAANGGLIVATDNDERKAREKLGLEQRAPDDEVLAVPSEDFSQIESGTGGAGLGGQNQPEPEQQPVASELDPAGEETAPAMMMTIEEAEQWLDVPRSAIMRAIRNGKLPGGKIGNTYRIPRAALEDHFRPSPSRPAIPPVPLI